MRFYFLLAGVSHYTKTVENSEDNVWFDETFQWPVARPIEKEEYIDIQLYNYNKYLSNKYVFCHFEWYS